MKLRNVISAEECDAWIVGCLNKTPAKCEPTIHVRGVGDLDDGDYPDWELIEADPLEVEMCRGCGFLRPGGANGPKAGPVIDRTKEDALASVSSVKCEGV